MLSKVRFSLIAALLAFLPDAVRAGLINFETNPDGATPSDNSRLTDPYKLDGGGTVRFFFDGNANNQFDAEDAVPEFEAVGSDFAHGFVAAQVGDLQFDQARVGADGSLGTHFLNKRNGLSAFFGGLVVQYDTVQNVRDISGEIWDIDGDGGRTERWLISAIDDDGNNLQQVLSPEGVTQDVDSLDSLPWNFEFRNLPDSFRAIRFDFVGTKSGYNLALDNLSTTFAVPEPSSIGMLGCCLALFTARRNRNRVA
jgi:hypothetical protein